MDQMTLPNFSLYYELEAAAREQQHLYLLEAKASGQYFQFILDGHIVAKILDIDFKPDVPKLYLQSDKGLKFDVPISNIKKMQPSNN